jgi:hypothetical protein
VRLRADAVPAETLIGIAAIKDLLRLEPHRKARA